MNATVPAAVSAPTPSSTIPGAKLTPAACPECNHLMHMLPVNAGVYAGCTACGATWTDAVAIDRLESGHVHPPAKAFLRAIARRPVVAPRAHDDYRTAAVRMQCPVCRDALEQHLFPSMNMGGFGCAKHGVYLKKGNIERLIDRGEARLPPAIDTSVEVVQSTSGSTVPVRLVLFFISLAIVMIRLALRH